MEGEGKGGELGLDGVAQVEGHALGGGFAGDALEVIEDAFDEGEPEQGEDRPGQDAGLVGFDALSMIQRMNWGMTVLRPRMMKRVR